MEETAAINSNYTRNASMNKENGTAAKSTDPAVRVTRARAKGLDTSGRLPPLRPSTSQGQKPILQKNSKRPASNVNKPSTSITAGLQHKKRAVLQDVTKITCDHPHKNCIIAAKDQVPVTNFLCDPPRINCTNAANDQSTKQAKKGSAKKNSKVAPAVSLKNPQVQEGAEAKISEEISNLNTYSSQPASLPVIKENTTNGQDKCISLCDAGVVEMIAVQEFSGTPQKIPFKKEGKFCEKPEASNDLQIIDVDSNHKDPQMCSLYAPDIYSNLHVMELHRRPLVNYMERLQQDITPIMRGILVDWLVEGWLHSNLEAYRKYKIRTHNALSLSFLVLFYQFVLLKVSEEYRLVPDTLYLTINLIDRFLSQHHIEKQRLQLLGVTCVLIASKYEETCAPRVEELCFITDNTYTREEVMKLESQVLNFLGFQLCTPTAKKFLRRFIQAAQVSCEVPCIELEFLANYLAELTLVEYSFLKFLPSIIAASAVFLARWTLNQSHHPWNPTLEHYTTYVTSDLKGAVLALEELQLNTDGCSLNAIREKYRQLKFNCVATLSSPAPVESVF